MEAPVRSVENLSEDQRGSNESKIVELENGEKGIFKPTAGDDPDLRRATGGSLVDREVAAYGVDQALGWGLVPTTVRRTINGQEGSLQRWMYGEDGMTLLDKVRAGTGNLGLSKNYRVKSDAASKINKNDLLRMHAFDHIMGNQDRRFPNLLVGRNGRLVAIDNGFSMTNIPLSSYNAGLQPRVLAGLGVKGADRLGAGDVATIRRVFGSPGTPVTAADISRVRGIMGNPGVGRFNVPDFKVRGVIERARGVVASGGQVGSMATAPEPEIIQAGRFF
jgi:hypothetical protein